GAANVSDRDLGSIDASLLGAPARYGGCNAVAALAFLFSWRRLSSARGTDHQQNGLAVWNYLGGEFHSYCWTVDINRSSQFPGEVQAWFSGCHGLCGNFSNIDGLLLASLAALLLLFIVAPHFHC